jgi:mannose-6-phosphate isomerase-like protein (cupin superfamily)
MNRVVTGFDGSGNPAVIWQGEPPTVIHAGRYTTTELWVSRRGPIQPGDADASAGEWALEPPAGGACFRVVEIAPGTGDEDEDADSSSEPGHDANEDGELTAEQEGFQDAHATATLDYVTVLRGEVTLVVGDTVVTLGPGDSVVQQPGVPHDWQNRSAEPAVMVGTLLSAL